MIVKRNERAYLWSVFKKMTHKAAGEQAGHTGCSSSTWNFSLRSFRRPCLQVRAATPAAQAALLTRARLFLRRHVRHIDITPLFHYSFKDMKRTHRWRAVSLFFPSLTPSLALSRGLKENQVLYLLIIINGKLHVHVNRHSDMFQPVRKADDTLMLLAFSGVLLTIREM